MYSAIETIVKFSFDFELKYKPELNFNYKINCIH